MRTIYVLFVITLIAAGMTACREDDKGLDRADTGVGEVSMAFGLGTGAKARALTPSTAMPATTWKDNIKDLMILFVEDGIVKDARNILPVPDAGDMAVKTFTFTNIKASSAGKQYDVYVIANSQQAGINAEKAAGGSWNMNSCVGSDITDLLMKLVVNTGFQPIGATEAGSTGYSEPEEIFVARQAGITVVADDNNDIKNRVFQLTRSISMMRVRIDQSKNGNNVVDFTGDNASFRVRRATTSTNPLSTIVRGGEKDVLYTLGGFQTADPITGYAGGVILNPSEHITLWKDIRMFPGGSATTGGKKFDIVLTGTAPAGYKPQGGSVLTAPGSVAWTGAVSTPVSPNYILEINLTLERAGIWIDPENPDIPEVGAYGDLEGSVQLMPWAGIVSEDIPV